MRATRLMASRPKGRGTGRPGSCDGLFAAGDRGLLGGLRLLTTNDARRHKAFAPMRVTESLPGAEAQFEFSELGFNPLSKLLVAVRFAASPFVKGVADQLESAASGLGSCHGLFSAWE